MPSRFPDMLTRLRSLREERGLSQASVAQTLGISQQYYSRYEKGETELPLRHFMALADLYGVEADYLLGRTGFSSGAPTKEAVESYLTRDCTTEQALSALTALDPSDRQRAVEYIQLLTLKETLDKTCTTPPPSAPAQPPKEEKTGLAKEKGQKSRKKKKGKGKRKVD